MKIAQVAPLHESVPPKLYGGTERIVAFLCDALVDLGHEVTLFACGDARTKAALVATRERALRLDPGPVHWELPAHVLQLAEVQRRADEFDLIHFHTDPIYFPVFAERARRTITTLHGRQDFTDLQLLYQHWPNFPLVCISRSQSSPISFVPDLSIVHHGLPLDLYHPPAEPRRDYLAFVGRMSPEKRPDRAIEIAERAGMALHMAAKIDPTEEVYFRREVQPLLQAAHVNYVGEIGEAQKSAFLGHAHALLFPIDWPEPFGLAMVEAMACGTPVIAWNCGSVPEIIDHGETGFIVASIEEAVEAVQRIGELDRARVRRRFEERFSAKTMARNYVALYERLLAGAARPSVAAAR
jgi:glycosyltransferase involved in cell wall biosynthesis